MQHATTTDGREDTTPATAALECLTQACDARSINVEACSGRDDGLSSSRPFLRGLTTTVDLPEIKPGSRAEWWLVTLAMAGVFLPFGALFGRDFAASLLNGDLVAQGLTPLGYAMYGMQGVVSGACFGIVLLRLLGKPSLWLGCVSMILLTIAMFFWPIALMIILAISAIETHGLIALLVVAGSVAIVVGLVMLMLCLDREGRHDASGPADA